MLGQADIRFKAVGAQMVLAHQVLFPVLVRIHRPSGEQALEEARHVVEQLRDTAAHTEFPGAQLVVPDLGSADGTFPADLTLEQKSQREVRLEVTFVVTLTFQEAIDFWMRATAIVRVVDLLQRFSVRPQEKGIDIDVQKGKLVTAGAPISELTAK